MDRITETLLRLFEEHRVIFWYDEKPALFEQIHELELPGVEMITVNRNAFALKHLLMREKPETRFLLYFQHARPAPEDNWLLDLELAFYVFQSDQEAMYLHELGLGYHLKELISEHLEFFRSRERRTKLKELLAEGDERQDIYYKMLAVVFGTENNSLVSFIQAQGSAYLKGLDRFDKDLERYNLNTYYWKEIARKYNYQSEKPGIYDFLLEVFQHNFILSEKRSLSGESRFLLSIWKNTYPYRDDFGKLSDRIAADSGIETMLIAAHFEDIIADELFSLSDKKIIHELANLITGRNITSEKVAAIHKQRENKFWYQQYAPMYQALVHAIELMELVARYDGLQYEHIMDGADSYAQHLHGIDAAYRKFILNYRKTGSDKALAQLAERVEKIYVNDWLLGFNNNWQKLIDLLPVWPSDMEKSQRHFFMMQVQPLLSKGQRVFVVISDALRYESGVELGRLIQMENRYNAQVDYMISLLPSYTQLGMAALLPHKELSYQEKSDVVQVDGMSSSGTSGRSKILSHNAKVKATAIQAEDFMKMNSAIEGREFVKKYELIYIYHNRIDKVGDDKTSEDKVFEAVEDELVFLREVLRKITAMNGNNILITSDHGFLYQYQELSDSDFSMSHYEGDVWKAHRRFILGRELKGDKSTRHFSSQALHLNVEALVPKSINRIRIKGAGSRFIHGGASLQEIIIPLIRVSKKRQDTTSQVDIDIIKSTDHITTNIIAVSFIQVQFVSEKVRPRTIQAAIYGEDGTLLSDIFNFHFDIEEERTRQREIKYRFQLSSKASARYKNQRVRLILEEPVENTNKWKHYKDFYYTLNISFASDFDD